MSHWKVYLVLGLGVFALGLGTGLGVSSHHESKKAQAAQTQSDQAEGAAKEKAAQASDTERQAAANQVSVNDADAKVAATKRELARLKAPTPITQPGPVAGSSSLPLSEGVELTQAVVTQQATVIAAQDQEIAALKLQVSIEHAAAVQWHQAYDESQKALALERIAKDAAVHQAESSGVRAQLVRGLEGLALGYAAGRVMK